MDEIEVIPASKTTGRVESVLVADGDGFVTRPVAEIALDLSGILVEGGHERHRGTARAADARVPWYPRGTPIRNSRQVSIVSAEELADMAAALSIADLRPEWLGANLVVSGLPRLSFLARGSRLFFPGHCCLAVEDQNAPCRGPGRVIQKHHPERQGLEFAFVRAGARRRGLVAWVERAGAIRAGDSIEVRIPEQWIY